MWVLQLNDIRAPKPEMSSSVARAETKEELESFLKSQKVDPYKDGLFQKTFKKGGILEWCNPPSDHFETFMDMDVWMKEWFKNNIMPIPEIPK